MFYSGIVSLQFNSVNTETKYCVIRSYIYYKLLGDNMNFLPN